MWSRDRILGALYGGAIGDAMGGPFEGRAGPLEWVPASEWSLSDDTQLTLATCEAIVLAGSVQASSIANQLLEWFRAGRLAGLGASTLRALRDLDAGQHWALAGRPGEMAAGNGAAMRAAPLGICLDTFAPTQRRILRDVCRITHRNDEAYVGALALTMTLRLAAERDTFSSSEVLSTVEENLPDSVVRDRIGAFLDLAEGTTPVAAAEKLGCSGYVAESVPLAIWASTTLADVGFEQLIVDLVSAGGDTDTIAAMAGQIAGARLGLSGLPAELVSRLPEEQMLRTIGGRFAELVIEDDEGEDLDAKAGH